MRRKAPPGRRRAAAIARQRPASSTQKSEEKFRKIFQQSLDVIAINAYPQGHYLDVSGEFENLAGFSREEVLGRTPLDLGLWVDREDLWWILKELDDKGVVRNREAKFRRKDGTVIEALFSAARIELGGQSCILSFSRDITDRKRTESALRERETQLRSVIGGAAIILWAMDRSGVVTVQEGKGLEALGLRPGEYVGRSVFELFGSRPEVHENAERAFAGEEFASVTEFAGRWLETRFTPSRDAQGDVTGVIGVSTDITEKRRLEEQLAQAQKMEAIGQLAGGVAHDFNNLLTAVRGRVFSALRSMVSGHPAREDLEEIDEAAKRAADLTRQLLAFARRQASSPKTLDLNVLVLDVQRMLRRLISASIDIVTVTAPHLWFVKADSTQIEQALINLVLNAGDAMPNGGQLFLETANVTLEAGVVGGDPHDAHGEHVMLAVRDTGWGMTEEVKAHVFEPFFTTKEPGKGTGLGLATCYGIARQNGGLITVESEVGRGSVFRMLFPRAREESAAASRGEADPLLPPGRETVLLVEDESSVRSTVAQVLRWQGYRVLEADGGEEALRLAQVNDGSPIQLLLTDIVMPGMGGKEVAARLLALRPDTTVLFMSGYSEEAIGRSGPVDVEVNFLQKPFSPVDLARKVREVLDARLWA